MIELPLITSETGFGNSLTNVGELVDVRRKYCPFQKSQA